MPIYEYLCIRDHRTEGIYESKEKRPRFIECPRCGQEAHYVLSAPSFRFLDEAHMPVMSDPKDIWEGTPLAGTDGINQAEHVSTSVQVDVGHRSSLRGRTEHLFPMKKGQPLPEISNRPWTPEDGI